MNIIEEIRDYFNARIKEVDSDLKFDGFIFGNEQTSAGQLDNTYKLVIGDSTSTRLNTSYERIFNISVWIYRKSGNERIDPYDKTYCKAIAIGSNCEDQNKVTQSGFIKGILENGVNPVPIDSDDNSTRFEVSFTVNTYYSVEE